MITDDETRNSKQQRMEESGGGVRLHVGGLGESVGRDDLLKIFSPMGSVDSVEFVRTKGRSFAYIDFSPSSNKSLTKLFSTYNGCIWKGGRLRLEKAKEHYLARLKREWEEEASSAAAVDNTIRESSDSNTTPSTHINIFFPRLRKVKAMPLSGTGKHKYSFQRVPVSSSLPKSFCDCEEHSKSLTPRETHVRDLEAVNVGIDEEEVNIMNSVMNKLFQKNNLPITKQVAEEDNDEQVQEEDNEIEADEDNLIINVVSSGKDTRDSELDILSRKRKSISNETTAIGEYTEGLKANHIHPTKKRQSIILEGSGKQEPALAIRENKKPSRKDLDKSADELSRTTSVKQLSNNISWSQKSSWKALMANGNNSNFSVSSFLPDVGSSKAVQPASSNTDLAESSAAMSTVTAKIKRTKSKRPTSKIMKSDSPVSDDVERNDSTAIDAIGSDNSKTLADTITGAVASDKSESVKEERVASTQGNSGNDKFSADSDANVAEDLSAEKETLVLKDNADHDLGKEEAGKESVKKLSGGSSWLQRGSWNQLVSNNNASFSITQLFPDLKSDKSEVARVNNTEEGQYSNTNQSESGMKQKDYTCSWGGFEAARVHADSIPVKGLEENRQSLINSKNASEGRRLTMRKPIRRMTGSGETCTFMRSSKSLNEWAKAKKALNEPRRKKKEEE